MGAVSVLFINTLHTNIEDFNEMPIAEKVNRFTAFPLYNSPCERQQSHLEEIPNRTKSIYYIDNKRLTLIFPKFGRF